MIFWRRKGIAVLASLFLGLVLGKYLIEFTGTESSAFMRDCMPFFIGAALNFIATKLLIPEGERILVDEETGQEFVYKDNSSLYGIPNKYWTPIIAAVGIVLYFYSQNSQ